MNNNLLPICTARGDHFSFGFRSRSEEEVHSEDFESSLSPRSEAVTNRQVIARSQKSRQISSQKAVPSTGGPSKLTASPATASIEQVDLTTLDDDADSDSSEINDHSNNPVQATAAGILEESMDAQGAPVRINKSAEAPEEHASSSIQGNSPSREIDTAAASANVDPVLDIIPLSDNHVTKYLTEARRQFTSERPPFVRLKKKEDPKTVTLAVGNGMLPNTAILATLVTREWDAKYSYYTLDCNGERLIVKPIGGFSVHRDRCGNPYRTWSGQGNIFEKAPVAFSLTGYTKGQPNNHKNVGHDLESEFEEVSIQGSDPLEDKDYSESEAQQGSKSQEPTTKPALPEPPVTRGRLAHLNHIRNNGNTRRPKDAPRDGPKPARRARFPQLCRSTSESSNAAPKISERAAGKRPASDIIDDDRSPKKLHPVSRNILINSSATARIPPTLTSYKQERTILHVQVPGSTTDMVPIKLRSAMTISTFFSSVSAAVGVVDYEHIAIAVALEGEDGGQDKTIIVKRNVIDTYEFFLEVVDDAACWEEKGGRMALQLQLR